MIPSINNNSPQYGVFRTIADHPFVATLCVGLVLTAALGKTIMRLFSETMLAKAEKQFEEVDTIYQEVRKRISDLESRKMATLDQMNKFKESLIESKKVAIAQGELPNEDEKERMARIDDLGALINNLEPVDDSLLQRDRDQALAWKNRMQAFYNYCH